MDNKEVSFEFCEVLEPYHLFNRLNNEQPLTLLDFRDSSAFDSISIRDSTHILSMKHLEESLRGQLDRHSRKGILYFAFLFSRDNSQELQNQALHIFQTVITAYEGRLTSSDVDNNVVVTSPEESVALPNDSSLQVKSHILFNAEHFFDIYASCEYIMTSPHSKKADHYYASEILPSFLFLGDYTNATNVHQLQALGITHIIDATCVRQSEAVAKQLNLEYLAVDIWDMEDVDIRPFFPITSSFINSALSCSPPGRVLVHCRAGWSRSPSIVLAYLLTHRNTGLLDATRQVVRQRPMVCPNAGFRDQLIQLEKELYTGKPPPPLGLCPDEMTLRKTILDESCLWILSGLTTETAFDRIPIAAFQQKNIGGEFASAVIEEEIAKKPKKAFLRKGEGKKKLGTAISAATT
eukprot:gene10417-11535_t